jgi:hypothetical protein
MCSQASSTVETCALACLCPSKEKPTFKGWSINNKCPRKFHELCTNLGFRYIIRIGPTSVYAPNRELAPGPPCSQINNGTLLLGSLKSNPGAPKS